MRRHRPSHHHSWGCHARNPPSRRQAQSQGPPQHLQHSSRAPHNPPCVDAMRNPGRGVTPSAPRPGRRRRPACSLSTPAPAVSRPDSETSPSTAVAGSGSDVAARGALSAAVATVATVPLTLVGSRAARTSLPPLTGSAGAGSGAAGPCTDTSPWDGARTRPPRGRAAGGGRGSSDDGLTGNDAVGNFSASKLCVK